MKNTTLLSGLILLLVLVAMTTGIQIIFDTAHASYIELPIIHEP